MNKINIFWLRRDLCLHDNAGLYYALKAGLPVLPIFIFDTHILNELEPTDARIQFIHQSLQAMQHQLATLQSGLKLFYAKPQEAFEELLKTYEIDTVFTNHDYEPYAQKRDDDIKQQLALHQIQFKSYKNQVIFEKEEVLKEDGTPYTVYTPYSKKWKQKLNDFYLKPYPTETYFSNFKKVETPFHFYSLLEMGFEANSTIQFPLPIANHSIVENYHLTRDIPSLLGTSQVSVHLRFGTMSIRALAKQALASNEKYLNELIWREFYQCILWHFPQVVNTAFKPAYDKIKWQNNEAHFEAWCTGKTGYPIVDAGMRELNATGWMHNRVRMIVASFLTKHLLIDWRWGEAYFAKKLNDFELASNNGGWQWVAGSGVDAAPYFRIFNPYLQTIKFDGKLQYIQKWVPEFEDFSYPKPIVAHEIARVKCLEVYKAAVGKLE